MPRRAGRLVPCRAVRESRASAHPVELLGAVVLAETKRAESISACHHGALLSRGSLLVGLELSFSCLCPGPSKAATP